MTDNLTLGQRDVITRALNLVDRRADLRAPDAATDPKLGALRLIAVDVAIEHLEYAVRMYQLSPR